MNNHSKQAVGWQEVITPATNIWTLHLKEIWNYRDLLSIWIRRDIFAIYKQTILGPLWFLIQPLLTALAYIIIFTRIAKFSTNNMPPIIFYMSGVILWSYFSDCILKTSSFLKDSAPVLSKVYFPRLIIPLSIVISNLIKLGIQFVLFLGVYVYYMVKQPGLLQPNIYLLLLPLLILLIGALGLGMGMLVASLTNRYKDLMHLLSFAVQILMFVSPVFFPVAGIGDAYYQKLILLNPMSGIIETFRFAFSGSGYFNWYLLLYDSVLIAVVLFVGVVVFNLVEKDFVDSI
jgi:lipopolysaccharide transport system permease protein